VCTPLCGGNIDTSVLGRVLERGLAADRRLVRFIVTVSDRPVPRPCNGYSDGYGRPVPRPLRPALPLSCPSVRPSVCRSDSHVSLSLSVTLCFPLLFRSSARLISRYRFCLMLCSPHLPQLSSDSAHLPHTVLPSSDSALILLISLSA
jgi:hypothetical protein